MMDAQEMAARLGVQATLARYTRYVDSGRAEQLAGLFTEDTVYQMSPQIVANGRAEIVPKVEELKTMFATAPGFGRIRHHVSSVVIELDSPTKARAMSYYCALAAAGPDHWGVYRDTLVVEADGQWRFASRAISLDGAVEASPVRWMIDQ